MCDKYARILHTCDRFVRMWQSNESVSSVNNSNIFVTPVKNSCDMYDKFIKKNICNAFIFTAAYLPKHNTVLWKEKCWGNILLLLWRLGIGRTRRWVSRLNRNAFRPVLNMKKSGNDRQPFIHFPIKWSQVLNYIAELHFVREQEW